MNETIMIPNEINAAAAFNAQAPLFDELYNNNEIIRYKRERVRNHVLRLLRDESKILELNGGTGDDAVFFAQHGHFIHSTDISQAMQDELQAKVIQYDLEEKVTFERRSYTDLKNLLDRGPFDQIFSNFAGLNCTSDLSQVLSSFDQLLKPGGIATLVILPKFCLWEFLLLFKGMFATSLRRFAGKKGAKAHIEGKHFRCWYYNPKEVRNMLSEKFELLSIEGLCTLVPPSYMEGFAEKHPKVYEFLKRKESSLKTSWPWKNIGDYYIISLRKKFS